MHITGGDVRAWSTGNLVFTLTLPMIQAINSLRQSGFWRRDESPGNWWEVVGWWESRRIAYNLLVGSVGIVSCLVAGVVATASYYLFDSEFGMPDPPLFAVIVVVLYAVMANVCYTGGWLGELLVRAAWPKQANRFATVTMSSGVLFSVLLTAAPGILLLAVGLFSLIGRHMGVTHGHPTGE
jgi:hypothetical protein